jgi:FkbM family methyltransferase
MSFLSTIRHRFHPLWTIRRTPWLFNIFHRLDFPVWVRPHSLGMKRRVMWFRDMNWVFDSVPKEPEFNELVTRLCEAIQPKVFWDVGANLGWFSWLVNAKAQLSQAVLFEPLPLNARLLGETIKANGFSHMTIIQAAVSDQCGSVSFKVDDKSGAASQIAALFDESSESACARGYDLKSEITVRMTTIDAEIAAGRPVPDLIKMDIESAEHLALKGAQRLLNDGRAIIAFECHQREAIDLLKARKWAIFPIDRLNNYLAVPPQRIDQVRHITSKLSPPE